MNPTTRIAVLPQPSTIPAAVSTAQSAVRRPAHDLDQRQHRRRVEEVEPDDALRAMRRRSAISETERALVFVARTTPGSDASSSFANMSRLIVEVLERGFDDELRAARGALDARHDRQSQQRLFGSAGRISSAGRIGRAGRIGSARRLGRSRLLRPAHEPGPDPLDGPIGRAWGTVEQRHLPARLERHLRDPRAHRPGADDGDQRAVLSLGAGHRAGAY